MAAKKSGRNILTRLLPAFFFLFVTCHGNVFAATDSLKSSCSPVQPFGAYYSGWTSHYMYVCLVGASSPGIDWMDLPVMRDGKAVRLRTGDPWIYGGEIRGFISGPIVPDIANYGLTSWVTPSLLSSYPTADRYIAWLSIGNEFSGGFVKYYFPPCDISKCKADLSTAKTSITADGQGLLSAFIAAPGALPCNTTICLTGKEAMFQPMADGVLLLGSLASGLIVIRKKRKK